MPRALREAPRMGLHVQNDWSALFSAALRSEALLRLPCLELVTGSNGYG
jgi:hypothetical protein